MVTRRPDDKQCPSVLPRTASVAPAHGKHPSPTRACSGSTSIHSEQPLKLRCASAVSQALPVSSYAFVHGHSTPAGLWGSGLS